MGGGRQESLLGLPHLRLPGAAASGGPADPPAGPPAGTPCWPSLLALALPAAPPCCPSLLPAPVAAACPCFCCLPLLLLCARFFWLSAAAIPVAAMPTASSAMAPQLAAAAAAAAMSLLLQPFLPLFWQHRRCHCCCNCLCRHFPSIQPTAAVQLLPACLPPLPLLPACESRLPEWHSACASAYAAPSACCQGLRGNQALWLGLFTRAAVVAVAGAALD